MLKIIGKSLAILLIMLVTSYAFAYFVPGFTTPFLKTKPLGNLVWKTAFYSHVALGTTALAVGPLLFWRAFRQRKPRWHRGLGRLYVPAILVGSVGAFIASFHVDDNGLAAIGFGNLAVAWFYTTFRAYRAIRQRDVARHQQWMTRSYALTLAGVTLRVILPLELVVFQMPFATAYALVAWLSWLPNAVVAEVLIRRQEIPNVPEPALQA